MTLFDQEAQNIQSLFKLHMLDCIHHSLISCHHRNRKYCCLKDWWHHHIYPHILHLIVHNFAHIYIKTCWYSTKSVLQYYKHYTWRYWSSIGHPNNLDKVHTSYLQRYNTNLGHINIFMLLDRKRIMPIHMQCRLFSSCKCYNLGWIMNMLSI